MLKYKKYGLIVVLMIVLNPLRAQNNYPLLDNYDVKYYGIELEVSDTTTYIQGSTTIYSKSLVEKLDTFLIELYDTLRVDSVHYAGQLNQYSHSDHKVIIPLTVPANKGQMFTITVFYHGMVKGKGFFSGITNGTAYRWDKPVTWTLSEPKSAHKWFACKQVLGDKADSSGLFLTTPAHCMAGANGILNNIVQLPDGRKRFEWRSFYPVAYYLLFFAVSDYQEYNIYAHPKGLDDSILIQNFVYDHPDYLEENKEKIDKTIELIELFDTLYGPYPFADEKYGHCLAPMGGGMENQTMTTLQSFYYLLVAHELGHTWFGNNVTCASWQDIWVNEGFASYSEYLAYEKLVSKEEAKAWMDAAHMLAKEKPHESVFVPEDRLDDPRRIFDVGLSYRKGAALVHMIRFELQNDEMFFQILRDFQKRFSDSVATAMDFKSVLEQNSGKNFTAFFDQWYFGKGYPSYSVEWAQADDTLSIIINQETTSDDPDLFKMLMHYRVYFEQGDTNLYIYQNQHHQVVNIFLPKLVKSVSIDPDNWTLEDSQIAQKLSFKGYFSVDPNPFNEVINIQFVDNNISRNVTISDLSGRVISKANTKKATYTLDGGQLNNGLYIITVDNGKQHYSKKILKMND